MVNNKKIEIASIKNLDLIYFYNVSSSNYLGLNIVHDGGKNLNYDYKYEFFDDYVARVVGVYKLEKNSRKIQFLNDESRNLIESFGSKSFVENNSSYFDDRINKYYSRGYEVMFLHDYIINSVDLLLRCFLPENFDFNNLIIEKSGNRDRFLALLKYNVQSFIDSKSDKYLMFPVFYTLIKSDLHKYKFMTRMSGPTEICGIDPSMFNVPNMSLNGNFNFYKDFLSLDYVSSDSSIVGKNVYSINNLDNFKMIKYNGSVISYNNSNLEVDRKIVDFYLNFLKLPNVKNIVRTCGNNYLLIDEDGNNKDFIHMSISSKFVNVMYEKSSGVYNENTFIPLDKSNLNINLMLEDDSNLVIERHYLETDISTGNYKKNYENKFNYEFYTIDSDSLNNVFNYSKKSKVLVK